MTGRADLLPVIARPDAEVSTFSEWTTGSPERQHAALDAWANRARPEGMLSYTCFLSTDGSTLRHHTQWTDDAARRRFWSAESPEAAPTRLAESQVARVRTIDEVVPGIERDGLAVYDLYHSHLAAGPAPSTGCVVIVTIDFEGPDRHRQAHWVDTVVTALETDLPEWRRVAEFAGVTDNTNIKRYLEHRSLSVAATTS